MSRVSEPEDDIEASYAWGTMNLSPHFRLREFRSRDGAHFPVGVVAQLRALAVDLERIRERAGPLRVTSGYRSPGHNRRVGGARGSLHVVGRAADIVARVSPAQLRRVILRLIDQGTIRDGGVGLYPGWVHYDHGPAGRRWVQR